MSIIRVTKEFHFEMAHALLGYDGLCKNIHGHSYKLLVTLKGKPIQDANSPKIGMVIDFSDLKKIIKDNIVEYYDHSLLLNKNTPIETQVELKKSYDKVYFTDFQPTCENMVIYIAQKLQPLIPNNTELFSIRLYETATSYAEWFAEDNQ